MTTNSHPTPTGLKRPKYGSPKADLRSAFIIAVVLSVWWLGSFLADALGVTNLSLYADESWSEILLIRLPTLLVVLTSGFFVLLRTFRWRWWAGVALLLFGCAACLGIGFTVSP